MKNYLSAVLALLTTFASSATAATLSGARPNIIVVMTDDQGYGDLSCHGHPYIKTPHIDKLRDQSSRFEDFFVSSSCAPTRAAIMSGKHPFKVGVTHTIFHREKMALDTKTIGQVMQDAGYSTGLFGKWHLGDEEQHRPQNRGFNEVLVHGSGIAGASGIRSNNSYFDLILRHNGKFVQTEGFCTDMFFNQSLAWMREQQKAGKPFMSLIFTNAPHGPFNAPQKYLDMYKDIEDPKHREKAGFFGLITNIDDNMGILMQKMKEWGMSENTILIFMTDNGSVASSVYNGVMQGGKTSVYEGGSRVPFFIRLPDKIKAGQDIHTLTRHVDLLPTFADLAGVDVSDLNLDGTSLLPLLDDPEAKLPGDRTQFFHKGRWGNEASKHAKHRKNPGADNNKFRSFGVRTEEWKLTVMKDLKKKAELYHVINDLGETKDVSKQYPEVVDSLVKSYSKWWDSVRPLMVNEDVDITEKTISWPALLKEQTGKEGLSKLPTVTLD